MTKYGVGQPVLRTEDPRLLKGVGKFNDDYSIDDMSYGYVLRSPYPHAEIISIDTSKAKNNPGVLDVFIGEDLHEDEIGGFPGPPPFFADLTKPDGSPLSYPPQYALTSDRVRYVGDPVAFIVADTLENAKDAAETIEIDYNQLPSVVDTSEAMDEGAAQLWEEVPNNFLFQAQVGDKEKTEKAFNEATHVVHVGLTNNRIVQNSMEVRGAVGSYDPKKEKYTLYTSNQNRHMLRDWIANSFLKCDPQMLQVLVDDVGGGFGMKTHAYHEQVLVLYAAKKLGTNIKWISDRTEAFLSDLHGRDHLSECYLALDENGKFLGVKVETIAAIGAYSCSAGVAIPTQVGPKILTNVYDIPTADVSVKCVMTNTAPVGPYRGAGRPEAIYVMERLVDVAAIELGIDPVELRRRNLIKPEQLPYTNAMGTTYDSGEFEENMNATMSLGDWDNYEERRQSSLDNGRLRGIGNCQYIETTAGNPTVNDTTGTEVQQ